jgi:hypothetical protein
LRRFALAVRPARTVLAETGQAVWGFKFFGLPLMWRDV